MEKKKRKRNEIKANVKNSVGLLQRYNDDESFPIDLLFYVFHSNFIKSERIPDVL